MFTAAFELKDHLESVDQSTVGKHAKEIFGPTSHTRVEVNRCYYPH